MPNMETGVCVLINYVSTLNVIIISRWYGNMSKWLLIPRLCGPGYGRHSCVTALCCKLALLTRGHSTA